MGILMKMYYHNSTLSHLQWYSNQQTSRASQEEFLSDRLEDKL